MEFKIQLHNQEGTKRMPIQYNLTTTVSHLHNETVLQFQKCYGTVLYVLKSSRGNLRLMKGFTLHVTGSFRPVCAIAR